MLAKNINRLPASTGHLIEAEQVIVDLVSVIKELVENSLDAESNLIEDNGTGISQENMVELATHRYSTSKIEHDSDLELSENYGFRGEALHSLIKLSKKVNITSSVCDSEAGTCKTFSDFGLNVDIKSKSRSKGTTISIEGLFESISVRRLDWFKRKSSILSQTILLLQSFAIMINTVKFSVYHIKDNNGPRSILFCTSGKGLNTSYNECFTKSSHRYFESIDSNLVIKNQSCGMKGLLVKNNDKGKSRFIIFLNRKPFDSPKLQRLIQQMLKKNFASGIEYFISLDVPGLWIDFNVTPDKRTMYILNENEIFSLLILECEKLLHSGLLIKATTSSTTSQDIKDLSQQHSCHHNETSETQSPCDKKRECWDESLISIGSAESVQLTRQDITKLVPLGQFNNGFIICSKLPDDSTSTATVTTTTTALMELYAIDQHAADERIRFEEISSKCSITTQKLFSPVKVDICVDDEDIISSKMDIFRSAGFHIRRDGVGGGFVLDTLPSFQGTECTLDDFFELLEYLKDHGILYKNLCPKFQRVLASRACRSAVMIGSPLTTSQMRSMLTKLSQTEYPWICAHGRPTVQLLNSTIN